MRYVLTCLKASGLGVAFAVGLFGVAVVAQSLGGGSLNNPFSGGTIASAILGPDGSASAPAYTFSNDSDSGWYRVGADNVALALNGAQELDLTAARADNLDDLSGLAHSDGNFAVSDGTDWTVESGSTARDSLSLGTADSPQFTAIELGNAADTTLARASAGDLNIEGNIAYRAGGTDVPLTDGGTGASTAASARSNLAAAGTGVANTFTQPQTFNTLKLDLRQADTYGFQGQQTAKAAGLEVSAFDGDGTDEVLLNIFGVIDNPFGSITNWELGSFRWDTSESAYGLFTLAAGTGTRRPIYLDAANGTDQIYLATDGKVGVGTASLSDTLNVDGSVGATVTEDNSASTSSHVGLTNDQNTAGVRALYQGSAGDGAAGLASGVFGIESAGANDAAFIVFTEDGSAGSFSEALRLDETAITFQDGQDIVLQTTTGTKIGTGTGQKIGFFNATPVAQQSAMTAKDASAVNSGDATTDGVITNNRTRIEELEVMVENLGLAAAN